MNSPLSPDTNSEIWLCLQTRYERKKTQGESDPNLKDVIRPSAIRNRSFLKLRSGIRAVIKGIYFLPEMRL